MCDNEREKRRNDQFVWSACKRTPNNMIHFKEICTLLEHGGESFLSISIILLNNIDTDITMVFTTLKLLSFANMTESNEIRDYRTSADSMCADNRISDEFVKYDVNVKIIATIIQLWQFMNSSIAFVSIKQQKITYMSFSKCPEKGIYIYSQ